jgi:hypothetical protein
MEPILTVAGHEAIDRDELLVHDWRVTQLTRLGSRGTWPRAPLATSTGTRSPGWFSAAAPRCSPSASSGDAVMNRALPRPGGRAGRRGHRCAGVTVCRVLGCTCRASWRTQVTASAMAEGYWNTIAGSDGAGPARPLEIDGGWVQRRDQKVGRATGS